MPSFFKKVPYKKIKTARLLLRQWTEEDLLPFAELNADPRVMEFYPSTYTSLESDNFVDKYKRSIEENGWGFWAVSSLDNSTFIGLIGIAEVKFQSSFVPAVEIGWRLAYDQWGKGYATEGAFAAVDFAFNSLCLEKLVSFTASVNKRSMRIMEKIGMERLPKEDFDHPALLEGHPLRRHVLYSLKNNQRLEEK
jgi:3-dehydroquinate dehydratase / shikimate dehydrogenase